MVAKFGCDEADFVNFGRFFAILENRWKILARYVAT